jgi:hypothetical protein
MSQNVCLWQAFLTKFNVRSLRWSGAHLNRLQPYWQTLDKAGKTCQGKTL